MVEIDAAFGFEPGIKRRGGNGAEDADDCLADAGLLDEVKLFVENPIVVVIESDDESRPDDQAGVAYAPQLVLYRIAAEVLHLSCFAKRGRSWRFYPDEDLTEVRLDHEFHQFRLIGQINAGFGREQQRIMIFPLPRNEFDKKLPRLVLVADEIVVNKETGSK